MNNLIVKKVIHLNNADDVITDINLKRIINVNYLGRAAETPISASELAWIDFIEVDEDSSIPDNEKVVDLDGLENASNLIWIKLPGNLISDISNLKGIANLIEINLEGNNFIGPLTDLNKNVISLILNRNNISDISEINHENILEQLELEGNEIKDISSLQNILGTLNKVVLTGNKIADVSVLTGFQSNDVAADKWAALGDQKVDNEPVFFSENADNTIKIEVPLVKEGEKIIKGINGEIPQVIDNFKCILIDGGTLVLGHYDRANNTVVFNNIADDQIPAAVEFDFFTEEIQAGVTTNTFYGTVTSKVAIYVENEEIRKVINDLLGKPEDNNPILYEDYKNGNIDTMTSVNLSDKGLINLDGIEVFKGATSIDVSNNNLLDAASLFKLKNIATIQVNATGQGNTFTDTATKGQKYVFPLERLLGENEKNSTLFDVKVEVIEGSISDGGVLSDDRQSIEWLILEDNPTLTFEYQKVYGTEGSITGASINILQDYGNITYTGNATINLTTGPGRGADLF